MVMSGKFGLVSGKSQGNVREFCFAKSVRTLNPSSGDINSSNLSCFSLDFFQNSYMDLNLPVRPSVCGHSNLVIFHWISSKFHIWIAFIKLSPKFEYGSCPTNDKQDGGQNCRHLSVCSFEHSNLSFITRFPPSFIYEFLLSILAQVRTYILSDE